MTSLQKVVFLFVMDNTLLNDVEAIYPASHYVMVDDKLHILMAMKKIWGARLTGIWPRQGHYAFDPQTIASYPATDITIEHIGDLVDYDLPALLSTTEDR